MPPRAVCASTDFHKIAAFAVLAAALLSGCSQSAWPEREAKAVDNVAVDSLKFLPIGGRFILADSSTPVLFDGFHKGFACTKMLDIELVRRGADSVPAGYHPKLALQLPSTGECPFDSAASDTVIGHVFPAGEDTVRLFGSQGHETDFAPLVRGRIAADSLVYLTDSLKTVVKGRWVYRDTAAGAGRMLRGDSLEPCERLNQAEFVQAKDTTRVRYTWVTLDSCSGGVHADSVPVIPAKP
jgi:hypothetical protein